MDLLKSITHPDEVLALLRFKFGGGKDTVLPPMKTNELSFDLKRCYYFLDLTSRSFAAVIKALDGDLRHATCIFYLVLRALDTVEDDMTIPREEKIPILETFHTKLDLDGWTYNKSQEKDKIVLEEFPVISREFQRLQPIYRTIIQDICRRMAQGMIKYLDRAPDTEQEWDDYCHYVAGLVGHGLSRLFAGSQLEAAVVGTDLDTANQMGLFLQKTNIIRDYLEDVLQQREFWPRSVWVRYGPTLLSLSEASRRRQAVYCLNELVVNALSHVPTCMLYLSRLRNQSVFNFCAIPQMMAVGTLERCYDNPDVFTGVVKIRKGEAVKMMLSCGDLEQVKAVFRNFCLRIQSRVPLDDPNANRSRHVLAECLRACAPAAGAQLQTAPRCNLYLPLLVVLALLLWRYYTLILDQLLS